MARLRRCRALTPASCLVTIFLPARMVDTVCPQERREQIPVNLRAEFSTRMPPRGEVGSAGAGARAD